MAAEASFRATNSGTFTVVVGDGNGGATGTGPYRLTLAKTGAPITVSAGDEGGTLTNGVMYTGVISHGDLDVWSFTANAGESMVVRMGDVGGTNTLDPWVRLYGPNGALLDSSYSSVAAAVPPTVALSPSWLVMATVVCLALAPIALHLPRPACRSSSPPEMKVEH